MNDESLIMSHMTFQNRETEMNEIFGYFKIDRLPENRNSKEMEIELDEFKTCQICVEKYDNKDRPRVVLTNCGHITCDQCAENIIKGNTVPYILFDS